MLRRITAMILALSLTGCQAYEPMPVDLDAHLGQWAQRVPQSASVSQLSRELAAMNGPGSASLTVDPADGITLNEAQLIALVFNPSLRLARLRARVPVVGAREAGRWDDPRIDFDALRIFESVGKPWMLGAGINFTIPLSGRLGVEQDKAMAEADVETRRAWLAEVDLLAELRQAWTKWTFATQRIAQLQAFLVQLDAVLPIAEQQHKLGKIGAMEERVFRIEKATRRGELAALNAEAAREERAITAMLGLRPDVPLSLLPAIGASPSEAARADAPAGSHPRLLLAKAEYAAAEEALRLEVRKQYPDLEIGPAYEYEEGTSKGGLALSLPLPILNANRRAIAQARASREAAKAALEGEYEAIIHETATARAALSAAAARRALLENEVGPLVDQQLADLRRLAELGQFDSLIYLDALSRSFEAKLQVLGAIEEEASAANLLRSLTSPALLTPTLKDLSTIGAQP
jgi:outer membrane protein TolC